MYRTIRCELWTDLKIRALEPLQTLLFVYLITNPHTHVSGIYYLPHPILLEETHLTDKASRYGIDTLSRLGLAHYDWERRVMWVVNMFEYQGQGPKNEQAAATHLRTLHDSPLCERFLLRYPGVSQYQDVTTRPSEIRYPIDGVSSLEKSCPSVPVPSSDAVSSLHSEGKESEKGEFEQFWSCYPKKVGKLEARKAFERAKSRPAIAVLVAAIHQALRSPSWTKEQGQFIPHPTTWLNQGRWDDQPLMASHAAIPPPPPKNDPIGRGQWGKTYGKPEDHGY
jgi:hypothetical protein